MKLHEAIPSEVINGLPARPKRYLDVEVTKQHFAETAAPWPGAHKNVHCWWELANGYAVGWNENPGKGWSFPVVKL